MVKFLQALKRAKYEILHGAGWMLLTYLACMGARFVKVQRTKERIYSRRCTLKHSFRCNFYLKFKRVLFSLLTLYLLNQSQ